MITTTETVSPNCFIKLQIYFLKYAMLWRVSVFSTWTFILSHLYLLLVITIFVVSSAGLIAKVTKTTDLVDRSEAIDIFTLVFSALYKMIYFIVRYKEFRNIVHFADKNFKKTPLFGSQIFTINKWMYWANPLSMTHGTCATLMIAFWGIIPVLKYLFGETSFKEMALPMNVWYPYNIKNKYTFIPLYIFHFIGLITSVQVYWASDCFLFALIYLACGQIEIIKISLREIGHRNTKGEESDNNRLRMCIEHHWKILYFLHKVDQLFRSLIVADVLHAIVSLSFAMLQASASKGVLEYIKMIAFVFYCFLHQFMNSFFGQVLINQQESLKNTVYEIEWSDKSNRFMRSVHIMLTNTTKPVKLSAWKMYFLQYETFVDFCRTMLSAFMVLRTLRDKIR